MFFFGKKEKMFLLKQNIISALIFQLSSVSIIIETNDLKKKKKSTLEQIVLITLLVILFLGKFEKI